MVAVAVAEREDTKPKGRTLERWIAECEFTVAIEPITRYASAAAIPCTWNGRHEPTKHRTSEAAVREAAKHAVDAGHVGAMAVTVRRIYKPRELDREEIVSE